MIAKEIERQAAEVKTLLSPSMGAAELEKATHHLNAILAEAERVRGLEQTANVNAGGQA